MLPTGYELLRYIKSSGTQYINTGFNPNNNTRVVMVCDLYTQAAAAWFFGARQSTGTNGLGFLTYTSKLRFDYGTITDGGYLTNTFSGKHTVDANKNTVSIDGVTQLTHTASTFQCPAALTLFANNTNGSMAGYSSMALYSCKIYDNGTLVRDFVPCKNSSGAVGLYDLVNGVFYANAGSGTFTYVLAAGAVDASGVSLVQGTSYGIKLGKTLVGGTAYDINKCKTLVGGTAYNISIKSVHVWEKYNRQKVINGDGGAYSTAILDPGYNDKFYISTDLEEVNFGTSYRPDIRYKMTGTIVCLTDKLTRYDDDDFGRRHYSTQTYRYGANFNTREDDEKNNPLTGRKASFYRPIAGSYYWVYAYDDDGDYWIALQRSKSSFGGYVSSGMEHFIPTSITYEKGSLVGEVEADTPDAYPTNGESGGYWYVYKGTR